MNDFSFVLTINGIKDPDTVEKIEDLLNEDFEYDFDADPNYLGLLAVALCGDDAFSWIENSFGRAFFDGGKISDDGVAKFYCRLNWPYVEEGSSNPLVRMVQDYQEDISIDLVVDDEYEDTSEEFGEDFKIHVDSSGQISYEGEYFADKEADNEY